MCKCTRVVYRERENIWAQGWRREYFVLGDVYKLLLCSFVFEVSYAYEHIHA